MQQDRKMLGEKLLDKGLISPEQLKIALEIQRSTGELLGEVLVNAGFISQEHLNTALSEEIGATCLSSLEEVVPDPSALRVLPRDVAQRCKAVPLLLEDNYLTVAMVNPYDVVTVDALRKATGKLIRTVVAPEGEILKAIDLWYLEEADRLEDLIRKATESVGRLGAEVVAEEAPLVKLVNLLLVEAVKERATDVHIEPEASTTVVRYRVDGILRVRKLLPKALERPIISRIKVMSNLDISESRLPQDGKADFRFGGRLLDLRVSVFPTSYGENVVIRILDRSRLITKIEALGFSGQQLETFRRLIHRPQGMVLVTGPTGCGKTTTLYAALSEINSTQINIMTIEDPIEYEIFFVRQSQVNPKIGLTFAKGLRTILRQDPDVILVGEIRDEETVEVAIHAALTGHLVLSTLHTNSAVQAIPRLRFMGAGPHVLASALAGVVAQRLVRLVCPECRETYTPTDEELEIIQRGLGDKFPEGSTLVLARGKGCKRCGFTGYMGRTAVAEVFEVGRELFDLIAGDVPTEQIERALAEWGYVTMFQDGLMKALEGITTVEEVRRVAI